MAVVEESFFALTPERVLAAVEVGGRRATGYAFALNSLENRVYEVELEDETRVVAKFYRPGRWSPAAISEEHAFLAELAAEEVPVVPPLALDGGTLGDAAGIWYALFPRVRGRVPEELDDAQLDRLGRLVARLHNVGSRRGAAERPRLDPETYGAASRALLLGRAERTFIPQPAPTAERTFIPQPAPTAERTFIPPELTTRFADAATRIVDACAPAWRDLELIRLHGDCHLGNLLWGKDGPFFLDFDDFLAGPPVQDLWLLAPGHDADAERQRARLARAYSTMRAFDRRTLRLVEPLRALRILRYAAWIAARYRDPAFQRAFPDFVEVSWWQREVQTLEEQLERVKQALV
jgi:Ser/Thr protein kinase RdoA (MazF antagonist)